MAAAAAATSSSHHQQQQQSVKIAFSNFLVRFQKGRSGPRGAC